jgi:site-specific DNA recombinase
MRAIVYSRVSTDAQERDGTSLAAQERACLELAAEHGWTVAARIREAAIGGRSRRDSESSARCAGRRARTRAHL